VLAPGQGGPDEPPDLVDDHGAGQHRPAEQGDPQGERNRLGWLEEGKLGVCGRSVRFGEKPEHRHVEDESDDAANRKSDRRLDDP
jgi:hypothetical protein